MAFQAQTSLADKALTASWKWAQKNIEDMRHVKKKLAKTKDHLELLVAKKGDIETRVKRELSCKINHEQLLSVTMWIRNVGGAISKFESVSADTAVREDGCCYLVKRLGRRRKQGKRLRQLDREIENLTNEKFDEVVIEQPPRRVIKKPIRRLTGADNTVAKIMDLVKDDDVGIIGVYGRPGIGKTSILTEINNKMDTTEPKFDMVIWLSLSGTAHDLAGITEVIARRLEIEQGEKWEKASQEEKASEICAKLEGKKIALLLDGVQERIDLEKLGVLLPNGSKLIFTTRRRHVCGLMDADKVIEVTPLSSEEARKLFLGKVRQNDPDKQSLVEEVCENCGGVPRVLTELGRLMASITKADDWEAVRGKMVACDTKDEASWATFMGEVQQIAEAATAA